MDLLDARGLRCPWPALRLAKAMREGAGAVRILADDPAAPREIAALAATHGWTVTADRQGGLIVSVDQAAVG